MPGFCPKINFIFVFLLFLSLFLFPKDAYAAQTINSVTLNGSSSVTVAPSASITAEVNATTTAGTNWNSTSWNISGANCVDHAKHTSNGTYVESFSVTAPASPGTYSISFIAHSNNNCGGTSSSTYTMTNAITVSGSTPSPSASPSPAPGETSSPQASGSPSPYYPSVTAQLVGQNPTNNPNINITGTASITQGTIKSITYSIDGSNSITTSADSSGNFGFTIHSPGEGSHIKNINAYSLAGNTSSTSVSFSVITTPPVVEILDPPQKPIWDQNPKINVKATSKLGKITSVQISLDGGKTWNNASSNGQCIYSSTFQKLEDANYSLIARAIDNVGNTGTSGPFTLIIDLIPPNIGGQTFFVGPLIISPSSDGVITLVANTDLIITSSMRGGVTEAAINIDDKKSICFA